MRHFGLLLLLLVLPAHRVEAQVRRCTMTDGTAVFTDRRCSDLGAQERRPTAAALPPVALKRAGTCMRSVRELVFELTSAIDSHDANRLASLYHWTGMGTDQAYAVLQRLDAVAQRPLLEVRPVYPRSAGSDDPEFYPQTVVRQTPVALRLEQTLGRGITPSRTVFGLQQHFGCWWIRG